MDSGKVNLALNLLKVGPLQGAPSALSSLLDVFADGNFLSFSDVKSLFRTMHSNNISINSSKVIDGIIWAQLEDWAETWDICDKRAILDVLNSLGYDFKTLGPIAIEGAIDVKGCFDDTALEQSVEAILEQGVSVNEYGNMLTPFQVAACLGNLRLIEKMLNQGAVLNREPFVSRGKTALQAAALGKNLKTVQYLVGLGADVGAAPALEGGLTALEAAIRPKMFAIKKPLLHEGDSENDVSEKIFLFFLDEEPKLLGLSNRPGSPLLHDLIYRRLLHLLEKVLSMGVDQGHYFQVTEYPPLYSPLQLACNLKDFEAIKLLVKYGADCNQSASWDYGRTALQAVVLNELERMDIAEYLIAHGANVNAPPAVFGGVTALQAASIRGHIKIVRLLLEKDADVNAPAAEEEGRTAVEGAAEHGRLDTVQLLLNAQAAKNTVRRTELESAIRLAKQNWHLAVACLIEDTLNAMCAN